MDITPRLLVIEDNPDICNMIRIVSDRETFTYAAEANTMDAAEECINELEAGTLDANVILLDGALSTGRPAGADAEILYPKIRRASPAALIIGISSYELAEFCPGIHDLTKYELTRLGEFVRKLMNKSG